MNMNASDQPLTQSSGGSKALREHNRTQSKVGQEGRAFDCEGMPKLKVSITEIRSGSPRGKFSYLGQCLSLCHRA